MSSKNITLIICYLFLMCILIHSLLFITVFEQYATLKMAVIYSITSTIVSYLIIIQNKNILNLGLFTVLFTYFNLTHFGASTIFLLYPESLYRQFEPHQYTWLYTKECVLAVLCSIVAQVVFILSASILRKKDSGTKLNNKTLTNTSIWIPRIGLLCLVTVFVYLLINIATGNFSLLSNYSDFRSWRNENTLFTIAIFLLATGYVIVIATGNRKQIKVINILFLVISLILLVTGNKGEILYAALTATGVYYSRTKKISKKIIVLGLGVFFVVIPFITAARSGSILKSFDQVGVNLTSPFLEIGWQLRTVEKVIHWSKSGESFGFGISYLAPIERIVSKLTLGVIPEIPITGVPWSFGERLPGWGFSQVAESFYNFSFFGPIIFYMILGWFSINAERQNNNIYKKAFFASTVVILMILTRNRFTFVPGQIFMAFGLVLFAYILDGNLKRKSKKI
ncbi:MULTISPECIES: O-antigen polysaccharide polymerase Wzy [unclassified Bacillus (in: firmicutes)]|nr:MULTISPECIES: O-antigen polysaccharide polymerase Wzy [unclassified Bacillus (in: firmicutes)]